MDPINPGGLLRPILSHIVPSSERSKVMAWEAVNGWISHRNFHTQLVGLDGWFLGGKIVVQIPWYLFGFTHLHSPKGLPKIWTEIDTTDSKMNNFLSLQQRDYFKRKGLSSNHQFCMGHLYTFVSFQRQGALESSLATAVGPASVSILADCILVGLMRWLFFYGVLCCFIAFNMFNYG